MQKKSDDQNVSDEHLSHFQLFAVIEETKCGCGLNVRSFPDPGSYVCVLNLICYHQVYKHRECAAASVAPLASWKSTSHSS